MKKVTIFLFLILTLLMTGCSENSVHNVKIEASDIQYHNALSSYGSALIQIDDKLYYSVGTYNNSFDYGIYEISNEGTKRIWYDGVKSLKDTGTYHSALVEYEGKLAEINGITGQISIFDFEKSEFEEVKDVYSPFVLNQCEIESFQIDNEARVECIELDGKYYYYVDDYGTITLYEYSLDTGDYTVICEISDMFKSIILSDIFSYDGSIYIEDHAPDNSIGAIKYTPKTNQIVYLTREKYAGKPINEKNAVYVINEYPYNIGDTNNGIYLTNLDTEKTVKIHSGYIKRWYVLDEKWVYYSLDDYSLWRVSIDGKINEKVFSN